MACQILAKVVRRGPKVELGNKSKHAKTNYAFAKFTPRIPPFHEHKYSAAPNRSLVFDPTAARQWKIIPLPARPAYQTARTLLPSSAKSLESLLLSSLILAPSTRVRLSSHTKSQADEGQESFNQWMGI